MNRRWRDPAPADTARFVPAAVFAAGLRNHHVANTAYPIAHERVWAPYRVPGGAVDDVAVAAWRGIDDLCLYAHIPFCETRCAFCEYTVVTREESRETGAYMDDLLRELALWRAHLGPRTLHGFDIGGGTPSFVPADEIARLLAAVRAAFSFAPGSDVSIETTPKIAAGQPEKIAAYRRLGIDRISMGIQVIQPDLLRVLRREANGAVEHVRAADAIRTAGFRRFNVDLMYGFAGQTGESWRATLAHAIALGPDAITLYRMRYKLTRISHQAPDVTLAGVRPLILLATRMLADAGFHANPGKTTYSRTPGDVGTSSYLARRVIDGLPYLGIGLGAQSFTHTTIGYNDGAAGKNLAPYRRALARGRLPIQDLYDLPARQMMGKMCAVAFYFGEIDRRAFAAKFGVPLEQAFAPEVEFVERRGLMTLGDRALSLTPDGALAVNGIIPLFAAPSIQAYLLARDPDGADDMHRARRAALRVAGEVAGV